VRAACAAPRAPRLLAAPPMAAFGGIGAQPAVNPNNDFTVRQGGGGASLARFCCCVRALNCVRVHPGAAPLPLPSRSW
jgi:hypothetical protein